MKSTRTCQQRANTCRQYATRTASKDQRHLSVDRRLRVFASKFSLSLPSKLVAIKPTKKSFSSLSATLHSSSIFTVCKIQSTNPSPILIAPRPFPHTFAIKKFFSENIKDKPTIELTKVLRKELKKFYKKVHPDLFNDYPEAKEANEKALQELMECVEAVKQDTTESLEHMLEFWVHDSDNYENDLYKIPLVIELYEHDTLSHKQGSIQRAIQQFLHVASNPRKKEKPPPNPQYHEHQSDGTDPNDFFAFNEAIQNEGPEDNDSQQGDDGATHLIEGDISFAAFLRQYGGLAMNRLVRTRRKEKDIGLIKAVLWIQYQIRTAFDMKGYSMTAELVLLRKLVLVLRNISVALAEKSFSHCVFCFSDRKIGIDELGRINLPVLKEQETEISTDKWESILLEVDVGNVHAIHNSIHDRIVKEHEIERRLGVSIRTEDPFFAVTPAYNAFLDRILSSQDPRFFDGQRFPGLSLSIIRDDDPSAQPYSFSPIHGVSVPVSGKPEDVVRYIRENAEICSKFQTRVTYERKREEEMIMTIRRQLKLAALNKDPNISFEQSSVCLAQLRSNAYLGPVLVGLSVSISDHFAVNSDGSVSIAWNFS